MNADSTVTQSQLAASTRRLEGLASMLADLSYRLRDDVDTLVGAQPQPPSAPPQGMSLTEGVKCSPKRPLLDNLSFIIDGVEEAHGRLRVNIERLEAAVV